MADKKISELNSLTGANAADGDLVAIVDVSATETKKITRSEFFTDTPSIDVGGTVTATGFVTTGDMTFGDNDKAIFGAGSDLQIYHTGDHSYIDESGTGNLYLSSNGSGTIIVGGGGTQAQFFTGGAVNLFYDNALKLTTTSTGIDVTGNATFADNGKAIFGAGSDLQIYHDGSNSFIDEVGTGRLYIRASDGIYMSTPSNALYLSTFDTGGLALFHNGNAKLATTATGIDVTGTVTADGLTVDGTALLTTSTYFGINSNTPQIRMLDLDSNVSYTMLDASNGDFVIDVDANNATAGSSFDVKIDTKNTLTASSGGDISFYEDTGTTPKFFWDASAERLNLTGDDDFQFSIKQGANEAWFLRAVSDGRFSLHLNGTGDIVTATSTGLGIGTVSPAATLDVNGTIKLDGNYPVGTGNVALGDTAFQSVTSGADNTAIGAGSLRDTTTASFLTAVGKNSLVQNTTGSYSTALGNAALFGNTTGGYNTAVGHHALLSNTTASNNTAVGYNAGYSGTTASENVIIGTNAGYSITTGVNNTFVGGADPASAYGAGGAITTGSKNTIIGRYDGNQGGLDIRTAEQQHRAVGWGWESEGSY
jgi:trimeric autotransporter adhesin